jgi:hypothetical protein
VSAAESELDVALDEARRMWQSLAERLEAPVAAA